MEIDELELQTPTLLALQQIVEDNATQMQKAHLLISRYNHERATNKDYNGRQLLELIQNADDAGSDHIEITLEKSGRRLQISNSGEPFSLKGFRSLMIPNLSSKIKKHYIGNKGLGFRSVLNWCEEVTIYSAGLRVHFSRQLAADHFADFYEPGAQEEIRREYSIAPQIVPFPLFAMPDIVAQLDYPQITMIDIRYREEAIRDIEKQLEELQPEVLLFLNHVIEIRIKGVVKDKIYQIKRDEDHATIGDRNWTLYDNKINGNDPELPADHKDADSVSFPEIVIPSRHTCLNISINGCPLSSGRASARLLPITLLSLPQICSIASLAVCITASSDT